MADPTTDKQIPLESAQPFLYSPPSGDRSRIAEDVPLGPKGPLVGGAAVEHAIKAAYEKGLAEGENRGRAEAVKLISEIRGQMSHLLQSFAKARTEYFDRVEAEVVRLSLSIARKILHRESQIDPLVLTGVVHVALQKLSSDTSVRLRAHPDEVRFWNEFFKHSADMFPHVEVLGDPSLTLGQCSLETDLGTTEVSLDAQLKEIEQGFFDLLERRPKEEE